MSKIADSSRSKMRTSLDLQRQILQMTSWNLVVHHAIYAAVKLLVPDLLGKRKKSAKELAESANCDPNSLFRLMRALTGVGLFEEDSKHNFSLTPIGELLRSDHPGSMRPWVLFSGSPSYLKVWEQIAQSIRYGKNSWRRTYGASFFQYLRTHPKFSTLFNDAMASLSWWEARALISAYDFGKHRKIVEVGGGTGELLCTILRANPNLRGILYDQEDVVRNARMLLKRQRVAKRCTVVGGNFLESVPKGGDAYLLKYVVHNWNDEHSIQILSNCRQAMGENGLLLVVETIIPRSTSRNCYPMISDLQMLVLLGSRERTASEYRTLLDKADLRLNKITRVSEQISMLEATAC